MSPSEMPISTASKVKSIDTFSIHSLFTFRHPRSRSTACVSGTQLFSRLIFCIFFVLEKKIVETGNVGDGRR